MWNARPDSGTRACFGRAIGPLQLRRSSVGSHICGGVLGGGPLRRYRRHESPHTVWERIAARGPGYRPDSVDFGGLRVTRTQLVW